jgi:hypothetical protein
MRCLVNVLAWVVLMSTAAAQGQTGPADQPATYKFTAGHYRFSDQSSGWDLNLRQTSEIGNVWLGLFQLGNQDISEWRAGWDRTFGREVRITPSIQSASGGFWGGSVQIEIGDPWFAAVGLGRTNLRPYFNLNFDPNDSYLVTIGKRSATHELFMLQYVRDNREHPDQQHLHFLYRTPVQQDQRLTVDLLYKQGLVGTSTIRRWGLTLGYDWPRYFVRMAWDPNVNFAIENALRLSIGYRF